MGNDPEFVDAHARLFQDAIAKEHLTDVDATLLAAAHPRLAALVGADVSDVSDVSDALGSDFFERPSLLAHACRGGETASHTTPFAWCTPFLKDFSRRHSSPALPFQRLTGKTFD